MTAGQVIEALGGYRNVAAALGRDPTRVNRWQRDGIPGGHWPAVIEMARRLGVSITPDTIVSAGKKAKPFHAAQDAQP